MNCMARYSLLFLLLIGHLASPNVLANNEKVVDAIQEPPVEQQQVTPEKVLETVDAIRAPGNNFSFDLLVTRKDQDDNQQFLFNVRVKDNEKSLVSYIKPHSSKGRRLLMVGENLWVYIPKTRRAIRISAQQKVSSGLSNADVARVVYSLDYNATSLNKTQINDTAAYQLSLEAKTKGAAYQRIELWVKPENYHPISAEFFTQTGRKLKTIYYEDYQLVLGKQRPMTLRVSDEGNKSQTLTMNYTNLAISETPDNYFQPNYLPRLLIK